MDYTKYLDIILEFLSKYSLKLVAAILIFIIGKWLSRKITDLIATLLKKSGIDDTLIGFFKSIAYYTLLVVVIIASIGQLGINTSSFLAILGAAGLAVGLAMKDSLSNFASGVMLILFRPFHAGDFVTAGGITGKVESITIFNTIINTPDNQKVIVPNGNITGSVITNINAYPTRRVDMVFGIGYDDDLKKAKNLLTQIIESDDRILKEPAAQVMLSELADSCVNINVRPWVKTEDYWDVYFNIMECVKLEFDKEGISIPYPQTDVHVYKEEKKT